MSRAALLVVLLSVLSSSTNIAQAQSISVDFYSRNESHGAISVFSRQRGVLSVDGSFRPVGPPLIEGYSAGSQDAHRAAALVGKFITRERDFGPRQVGAFQRGGRYPLPNSLAERVEVSIAPKSRTGNYAIDPPLSNDAVADANVHEHVQPDDGKKSWKIRVNNDGLYTQVEIDAAIEYYQNQLQDVRAGQGDGSFAAFMAERWILQWQNTKPKAGTTPVDDDKAFEEDLDALVKEASAKLDARHEASRERMKAHAEQVKAEMTRQAQLNDQAIARARTIQQVAAAQMRAMIATNLTTLAETARSQRGVSPRVTSGGTTKGEGATGADIELYDIQVMQIIVGQGGEHLESVVIEGSQFHIHRGIPLQNAQEHVEFCKSMTAESMKRHNRIIRGPYRINSTARGDDAPRRAGSSANSLIRPLDALQELAKSAYTWNDSPTDSTYSLGPPMRAKASDSSGSPDDSPADSPVPRGNEMGQTELVEAITSLEQQAKSAEALFGKDNQTVKELWAQIGALREQAKSGKNPKRSAADLPPEESYLPQWVWTGGTIDIPRYEMKHGKGAHSEVGFKPDFPVDPDKMPPGWSIDKDHGVIYRARPHPNQIADREHTQKILKQGGGPLYGGAPYGPYDAYIEFKKDYKP